VLARGLIADGREHEIEEIRAFISAIVPDPDSATPIDQMVTATERSGSHDPE